MQGHHVCGYPHAPARVPSYDEAGVERAHPQEELDRKAATALTEFRRDECEAKRTAFEALKAERDDEIRKAREALIRERLDSLSPADGVMALSEDNAVCESRASPGRVDS